LYMFGAEVTLDADVYHAAAHPPPAAGDFERLGRDFSVGHYFSLVSAPSASFRFLSY
jgi:anthranilate/para-aminobenzoate synthase component II